MDSWFIRFIVLCSLLLAGTIMLPITWWWKPVLLVIEWFILITFMSRLVIPRLGFTTKPLPTRIPLIIQREVNKLRGTPEDVLRQAYNIITSRFKGGGGSTFTQFSKMMWKDMSKAWNDKGFAQCTTQTFFLRLLLVKSGRFREEDVKVKHQLLRFNIHQYLLVRIKNKWVAVDPWARFKGIPLGRKIDYWFTHKYNPRHYEGLYLKTRFINHWLVPRITKRG